MEIMMRKRVPQKKTLQKFFSCFTFNQYSLLLHGRSDALFPKEIQLRAKIGRNTLFNSVIPWGLKKGFIKREGRKIFWVPFKYFSPLKKPKKLVSMFTITNLYASKLMNTAKNF
jgi:predicted DNA-binding transcriptional regulator